MKVNITIAEPHQTGTFADVKLSFTDLDGTLRSVKLNIAFQSLYDYNKDSKSKYFDFFFVASLVYGIDNLLDRQKYSIDGWARDIEVSFPVKNVAGWKKLSESLGETLSFLTGDYWQVSFTKIGDIDLFKERTNRQARSIPSYHRDKYTFASLFSGGLDSLVGVIDGLENLQPGQMALLISHYDPSSSGTNSDQERLDKFLNKPSNYNGKYDWVQIAVDLSTVDTAGNAISKESSLRSRSLLFNAIGVFCLGSMTQCNTLTIPENGTISLNFPLTPSRSSTLSTRTTHPHFLSKLQELTSHLGLSLTLENPYSKLTKGELVQACTNDAKLKLSYELSVSCGKRGHRRTWDTRVGTNHCGVCMPCVYRRAALHTKGWDTQIYGTDIFSTKKTEKDITDMPALLDFLKKGLTTEQIKRTLLVSGSLPLSELDDYARLVEAVINEIKQWIKDKGSAKLKKLAGIK